MSSDIFNAALVDRVLRPGRTAYYQDDLNVSSYAEGPPPVARPDKANLVGSKYGDRHLPVIDLDVPALLLDSSTPGHHHLYIDKPVDEDKYWKLLEALADAGLVEPGYVRASKARGQTFVRKPGITKPKREDPF